MPRPVRAFKAESFELEGRLLLAARIPTTPTAPPTSPPPPVQFVSATTPPPASMLHGPIEVVTQQAGEATVTLSRPDTTGSLQVEVTTDPSSPYVGVNVGAVDQTVTFADGQSQAILTVPIIAGAPNPGVVDVDLSVETNVLPMGMDGLPTIMYDHSSMTLDLKVLATDPTTPPKVAFVVPTNRGILLGFNKPMDPAGASDVNHYTLKYMTVWSSASVKSVPIQSAQYDPATQTVTLVPKKPIPSFGGLFTGLSEAPTAKKPVRRGHRPNVSGSLVDLQGNPINAGTTPGKVVLLDSFTPPTSVSF